MAEGVGTSESMSRAVALIAVVALHVFLSYVANRLRSAAFERDDPSDRALTWLRLDLVAHERKHVEQHVDVDERVGEPQVARAQNNERPNTSKAVAVAELPPAPPQQVNWRANAARSAQLIVAGSAQEGYRDFGPRKEADLEAKAPQSVFGSGPNRKSGEIGEDAYGDPALWHNDNCYQELEKTVPTARDVFTIVPMVKCFMRIGRPEANGKLFEHIRKREEPPVPKAGTETGELPERSEVERE